LPQVLKTASITHRLASLGAERWAVHFEARRRANAGEDIIELTIGEPDIAVPEKLIEVAYQSMRAGRTKYSAGRGEAILIDAIARKYTERAGRKITDKNILCLPGTQAALTIAMLALVEKGDGVLVPDPYYATYQGVVAATGAEFIAVPMDAKNGFHLTASQLEAAITPHSKVLLLNSPHNPTGAVMTAKELEEIGRVCAAHDLWVVCDEVYEDLIYEGTFASLFDVAEFQDRTIAVSSISKSHAAPGFRSGWCAGPVEFTNMMQGVSEAILFGSQPFIADMTAFALDNQDDTASKMAASYKRRIALLESAFSKTDSVAALIPDSGMFMLVDVSASGLSGSGFSERLLNDKNVAVMPGDAFGQRAANYIRLSLTVEDDLLVKAADRIVELAEMLRSNHTTMNAGTNTDG